MAVRSRKLRSETMVFIVQSFSLPEENDPESKPQGTCLVTQSPRRGSVANPDRAVLQLKHCFVFTAFCWALALNVNLSIMRSRFWCIQVLMWRKAPRLLEPPSRWLKVRLVLGEAWWRGLVILSWSEALEQFTYCRERHSLAGARFLRSKRVPRGHNSA